MKVGFVRGAVVFAGAFLIALAAHPMAGGQSAASGKAAYDRVCAECHAPEGKGKGGADDAPGLVPMTKDLKTLMAIVREGGCKMPTIPASQVSDEEVGQILVYLKSLSTS
jgi:mono/diheme cytochrome c family protein